MSSPGPEHWLELASRHREAGRFAEAADAYERLLALRPDLPNSWYNLGFVRRQAGDYAGSLTAYDRALQLGVEGPEEVHLNRAAILADHLGRSDEAEAELKRALACNPRYLPAWLNYGNLHE